MQTEIAENEMMEIIERICDETYKAYDEIIAKYDEKHNGFDPSIMRAICYSACFNFCITICDSTLANFEAAGFKIDRSEFVDNMFELFNSILYTERPNHHSGNETIN